MGQGGSSFFKDVWDDTIGGLIHGVERLFETGGGSAIYGPAAKPVGPFAPTPPPPKLPQAPGQPRSQTGQLMPQQGAIQNSFNTANQYQARFGATQHF
jgi:hypothetical protein